ncbi:PH domain-containing protein [Chloroflexota bacterium]
MWLKLLLGGVLLLLLITGFLRLSNNAVEAATIFGVVGFLVLLCLAILPRRYQIYSNKVSIVLGGPLAFNIHFNTIKEAKPTRGYKAFAYGGIRFVTSSKTALEITRSKGLNVVISPSDREVFMEHLQRALPEKSDSTKLEDDLFGLSKWLRF